MMIFLIIVHVIACVTLIAVILLQAGRGHGLAGSSFGSEMNAVFGTKTAKFMTKATTTCAILFLVTCLGIDVLISSKSRSLMSADSKPALTQEQINEVMAKLKDAQAKAEQAKTEGEAAKDAVVDVAANVPIAD